MLRHPSFRRGLRDGFLLFFAVALFGVGFGVLAVQAGLPPWLASLASVVIVSGAAQFTMVGLLAAGPGPVLIAATGLALRHVPMSAALSRLIGERARQVRAALAWVLVDETFGLTVNAARRGEEDLVAYKAAVDLELYSGWVTGTVLGAYVGAGLDPARLGIDVLFPLLFLGLAAPLVRSRREWVTALAAVAAGVMAVVVLPPAWRETGAAAVAAAVGAAVRE